MSSIQHQAMAEAQQKSLRFIILTISDTRTAETDQSGAIIRNLLQEDGHQLIEYRLLPDEPDDVAAYVQQVIAKQQCDVLITNGGTGISARDTTIEAIQPLITKPLQGFGELFRMLSYQEIGSAAMLSRAIAGIAQNTVVFCLPGSANAVCLAVSKLILPEMLHIAWELKRQKSA